MAGAVVLVLVVWALLPGRPAPRSANSKGGGPSPKVPVAAAAEAPEAPPPPFPPIKWAVPSGVSTAEALPLPEVIATPPPGNGEVTVMSNGEFLRGRRGDYLYSRQFNIMAASVVCGRVDPESRKVVEVGILGTAYPRYAGLWGEFGLPPVVDIAEDGKIALYRPDPAGSGLVNSQGPESTGRVRAWPAGAGPAPLPLDVACKFGPWIGWAANGRLLVLTQGKLTSWDVESGQKVRDFSGNLVGRAALPPARNWVVVCVEGKYLEVLDVETGACLGRLPGDGGGLGVAVRHRGRYPAGRSASRRRRQGEDLGPLVREGRFRSG